ncbi:hypothetical protein GGS24DRAFT_516334 [Hypoxylon argillaceum]|nr:hypothetical protein GGS24DRAFT_516334 [Hypoxylon argillaceum]
MMNSNFDILATTLLAVITIVFISTISLLIIRLPSARAQSDLVWESRVLGEWAKYQKRLLRNSLVLDSLDGHRRTSYLSLELARLTRVFNLWRPPILELPVIFLASPDNIDGSVESYEKTRTTPPESHHVDSFMSDLSDQSVPQGHVSITANDKASWLGLLEVLQQMARDSRIWEDRQWQEIPGGRPENVEMTSLAVGVQLYRRVFDGTSMFKRPYAITTIRHIVEMAAVLGIYWKQFDRNKDKYRAEGNGLSLRGTRIDGLGLVFSFERIGWCKFEEKRVIPTSVVKELCFGSAPTFYRLKHPSEDTAWQDAIITRRQSTLETLRLGSPQDLSATLTLIGCNQDTVSSFLTPESKKSHLFPVVFEIMGMLCQTYHLKNRCFTCLPNPTMHHWNKRELSLRRLLSAFREYLPTAFPKTSEFEPGVEKVVPSDLKYIQLIADELDCQLPRGDQQFNLIQLDQLHDAISRIDRILDERSTPKAIVLDVIRRHLQALLQDINNPSMSIYTYEKAPLKDFFLLPPEYREHELMKVYFSEIRHCVVSLASSGGGAGNVNFKQGPKDASRAVHEASNIDSVSGFKNRRTTIWCALVFRTICWLLLHDFDEQDVQLPKSEVQGSRLPVYIQ